MATTRDFKSPGVFALNASTTIPPVPIQGVSYRDITTTIAEANDGWPYAEVVNSAEYNQILHQYSSMLNSMDKQGILGWSNQVDYAVPAIVFGSNNTIYLATAASGPATAVQDPISTTGFWISLSQALLPSTVIDGATFEASVANGEVVYWDNANSRFDEAIATGTATQNAIGIADVTNARVHLFGLVTGLSGLTPNTAYYLSTATPGAITTTKPVTNAVRIGTSKGTTTIYLDINHLNNSGSVVTNQTRITSSTVQALIGASIEEQTFTPLSYTFTADGSLYWIKLKLNANISTLSVIGDSRSIYSLKNGATVLDKSAFNSQTGVFYGEVATLSYLGTLTGTVNLTATFQKTWTDNSIAINADTNNQDTNTSGQISTLEILKVA